MQILAGKGGHAGGQQRQGRAERRVGEHDHRSFAAELEVQPFQCLGTSSRDLPADRNAAGKADHVHISGLDQEPRTGVAGLGKHIDHAGRQ